MPCNASTLGPAYSRARNALKNNAARDNLDEHIALAGLHHAVAESIAGKLEWTPTKKEKRPYASAEYELSAKGRMPTFDGEEATAPLRLRIVSNPHADRADSYWEGNMQFGTETEEFLDSSIDIPYRTLRRMRLPGVNLYEPIDLD